MVFLRRAAHPAFGLSPLTPLLILISVVQLWGYCNLQRIRLLEKVADVFLDFMQELEHETKLRSQLEYITRQLESPRLLYMAIAAVASAVLAQSVFADLVSLEPAPLTLVFRLLFGVVAMAVAYAGYRFLRQWLQFGRFLELVAHHPLVAALERIPDTLARSIGSLFLEELPEHARYEAEQAHVRLLKNQLQQLHLDVELQGLSPADAEPLRPLFKDLEEALAEAHKPSSSMAADPGERYDEQRLTQVSRVLIRILKAFWRARPLPGTLPAPSAVPHNQSTAAVYALALPPGLALWLRLAEDFIAIQVVAYIHRLFPHLRNTLVFFTGALLLMLFAIVTYPFQPQHFLGLVLWTMMLCAVALTVMVFVQMSRNETLSRIARTEPGKVNFDRRFLSQLVLYGVLPLLSLLAAQFPEVRGFAFSWFETILKTLK
jgi:hypothetical protein